MAKVFIVGATGGVGSRLVPMLVEAGHEVHGLHRKPEDAETLRGQGATPHQGDLMEMTDSDFDPLVEGCDAVVFSAGAAGSGQERATVIDGDTPGKLARAMDRKAVSRMIVVSVFPEAGRQRETKEGFEHYMACKKRAEVEIAASGLDWVFVRPGTLQSTDGDGRVNAGRVVAYGDVARGNVAAVIAGLIARPDITREAIELTDGDVPVADALEALAR